MTQKLINATHNLVKTFRALERAQKDLDYKLSCWARDLRALCASEKEFNKWCETELGLPEGKARELLDRAALVAVVPDADTFNDRGGFNKLRPILAFPKREQVAIVQAATVETRSIANVIKLRHPVAPAPGEPIMPPSSAATRRDLKDAAAFALYIIAHCDTRKLPEDIRVRVEMYCPGRTRRASKPDARA